MATSTRLSKVFEIRYRVSGSGEFPIDMLRYDHAWPEHETDSNDIGLDGPRTINLCRCAADRGIPLSVGRWQSFGWLITFYDGRLL